MSHFIFAPVFNTLRSCAFAEVRGQLLSKTPYVLSVLYYETSIRLVAGRVPARALVVGRTGQRKVS